MRKILMSCFMVGMLMILAACGGSSGDGTVSSGTTTSTSYLGPAVQGDFAKFSFNSDDSLAYELSGAHFDGVSGTVDTTQYNGNYYLATVGAYNLGVFVASNIAMAVLPDESGATPFIVGLSNPSVDMTDIADKTYVYIEYRSNTAGANLVTINSDNTVTAQAIEDNLTPPGTSNIYTGCWAESSNGAYINVLMGSTDCSAVDETSTDVNYLRVVIKPGVDRNGFVVDYADGSGFGIGLEQKSVSAPAADVTYNTLGLDFSNIDFTGADLFHQIVVHSDGSATEYDLDGNVTSTMNIAYDKVCDQDESTSVTYDFTGMACASMLTGDGAGKDFNVFIDFEDGYFVAEMESSTFFTIGATN